MRAPFRPENPPSGRDPAAARAAAPYPRPPHDRRRTKPLPAPATVQAAARPCSDAAGGRSAGIVRLVHETRALRAPARLRPPRRRLARQRARPRPHAASDQSLAAEGRAAPPAPPGLPADHAMTIAAIRPPAPRPPASAGSIWAATASSAAPRRFASVVASLPRIQSILPATNALTFPAGISNSRISSTAILQCRAQGRARAVVARWARSITFHA